jgi:hypothetical protein
VITIVALVLIILVIVKIALTVISVILCGTVMVLYIGHHLLFSVGDNEITLRLFKQVPANGELNCSKEKRIWLMLSFAHRDEI